MGIRDRRSGSAQRLEVTAAVASALPRSNRKNWPFAHSGVWVGKGAAQPAGCGFGQVEERFRVEQFEGLLVTSCEEVPGWNWSGQKPLQLGAPKCSR